MKYFKKEGLRNPIFGADKKPVQFQPIPGDAGVISLDENNPADKTALTALQESADGRRGGVVQISAEIYDSLKKNAVFPTSQRPSSFPLNQMRVSPSIESFGLRPVAPPVEGVSANKQTIRAIPPDEPPSSIAQFRARSRPANQPPPPQ